MNNVHPIFAQALAPFRPCTRGDWQRALEQSIQTFNGDAIEASELLCAVIASLENHYDRDKLGDVQHEFKQLKEALEELDRTGMTPTEQDIAEIVGEMRYERDVQREIEKA